MHDSDFWLTSGKKKSVFCQGVFEIQDVIVVAEDHLDNKDPAPLGYSSGFCFRLSCQHNLMFAVPSQASQGQHVPSWVIKNPSSCSVPHWVIIPSLVSLPAPLPLGTEIVSSLAYKSHENCHRPGMWLLAALPRMLFLVLVICNGHIISGSIAVPHVLGRVSLSSSENGPLLLGPSCNLKQGGEVAASVTRMFVVSLLPLGQGCCLPSLPPPPCC